MGPLDDEKYVLEQLALLEPIHVFVMWGGPLDGVELEQGTELPIERFLLFGSSRDDVVIHDPAGERGYYVFNVTTDRWEYTKRNPLGGA